VPQAEVRRTVSRGVEPTRCVIDRLEEYVRCEQWDNKTNESAALDAFNKQQLASSGPLPYLEEPELTLSRDAVNRWISVVRDGCKESYLCAHQP